MRKRARALTHSNTRRHIRCARRMNEKRFLSKNEIRPIENELFLLRRRKCIYANGIV